MHGQNQTGVGLRVGGGDGWGGETGGGKMGTIVFEQQQKINIGNH